MTAAQKLYELIQTLPEAQINEVLDFAEFLSQTHIPPQPTVAPPIPPATLTGLRCITKRAGQTLSDQDIQTDYTDHLIQKYQPSSGCKVLVDMNIVFDLLLEN